MKILLMYIIKPLEMHCTQDVTCFKSMYLLSMDDSTTECDNTIVEVNVLKDDLTNGFDDMKISEKAIQNGDELVCDEREGNIATDMKDVVQSMIFLPIVHLVLLKMKL